MRGDELSNRVWKAINAANAARDAEFNRLGPGTPPEQRQRLSVAAGEAAYRRAIQAQEQPRG